MHGKTVKSTIIVINKFNNLSAEAKKPVAESQDRAQSSNIVKAWGTSFPKPLVRSPLIQKQKG
jgi:hypothetical protein